MKSKTSFFNKGIVINELKRFYWVGIVYLLSLFFSVPMAIIMENNNMKNYEFYGYSNVIKQIFEFRTGQTPLLWFVPILVGLLLFRYMQVKKSSDMVHSLPVKRKVIYNSQLLVGILLITIPLIITTIICAILNSTLSYNEHYKEVVHIVDIIRWGGISIFLGILIFMFTALVGMITGISAIQGVLSCIFLFLPVGLTGLILYNTDILIDGFNANLFLRGDLLKLSPLTIASEVSSKDLTSLKAIITYIIIYIILYYVSRFLYNKRNLESASQSIAFKEFKPVFKYGVTFCSMLLGGLYFGGMRNGIYWLILGYIVTSLIGYIIAEITIKKSLRVLGSLKGYLIYLGIIGLILLGMKFDVLGYEKHIPSLDKVESIYFDNNFYRLMDKETVFYHDKNNWENIQQLHAQIINNKQKGSEIESFDGNVAIVYKLKNGKTIKRLYGINKEEYAKYLKSIYESKEYKKINNRIFDITDVDVDRIIISPREPSNKQASIIDREDIKECIDILKNEINNQKYEDMIDNKMEWAHIDISLKEDKNRKEEDENFIEGKYNHGINMQWEKSFVKFEKWLEEKDYLKNSRITTEDVAYAVVEKREKIDDIHIDENNKNVKRLDILDKDKIEVCLRNYENKYYKKDSNAKYVIGFYSEDKQNIFYGSFNEDNAPDFIKDFFK
ncbi:MAG: DUF6449 domain-containing protein [Tepidibacter sp.]|jgi:ABC-2 type transport system permease protein|uniref:DUF6449 domain-containing protein n=1 Tax=Tepidibacter sp. TaxID=2529387 RepID=UPI0025FF98BC|nr:DUF6449 domain-containing protein [Tepidibacter sp.]MCT4507389.1 DUF6449 domain-containing protein [Tepidibacter sp.]